MLEIEILEVAATKRRSWNYPSGLGAAHRSEYQRLNKLKSSTNLTNLLTNIQQVFAGKDSPAYRPLYPSAEPLYFSAHLRAALSISPILFAGQSGRQVLLRRAKWKAASFFVGGSLSHYAVFASGSVGTAL